MSTLSRVFSAVQPSGDIHLGNYLGAVRSWVPLQDTYDVFYCVADLHTVTVPHQPKQLALDTLKVAMLYLAAGIDPDKATIFVQSHVPAHAELAWLLGSLTPVNWLQRMNQYRAKSETNNGTGLLTYPVLMAADILLYRAALVPVGSDQTQHLELTRDIAKRFNATYGKLFPEPQALVQTEGQRVMSLANGSEKMSKSAPDHTRIGLLDTPDTIVRKIKKAKSDLIPSIYRDPARPEASNLLTIYALALGKTVEDAQTQTETMNWGGFKSQLADAVVSYLEPIQGRYLELSRDPSHLSGILHRGAERARAEAEHTLRAVKERMGYLL